MTDRPTLFELYARIRDAQRQLALGTMIVHEASGGVYEVISYTIRESDGELMINYSSGLVGFSRPFKELRTPVLIGEGYLPRFRLTGYRAASNG